MKLTIIGTGNMGRALLGGFVSGGVFEPKNITLYDVRIEAAKEVASKYGCSYKENAKEAVADSDYVLMAVKPIHFDGALRDIADSLKSSCIVLSIAAAVTCDRIAGIIGPTRKFVRIMPNTPAQVGAGVSAVCPVG